jgi:predicted nucleic acid-binding protein
MDHDRLFLTSEFVLLEVGDGMSRGANRFRFARLVNLLQSQPDVGIIPVTSELFQKAGEMHSQRPDKEWSLTDCASFLIMKERNIEEALTSDHHFAQAGFRPLIEL